MPTNAPPRRSASVIGEILMTTSARLFVTGINSSRVFRRGSVRAFGITSSVIVNYPPIGDNNCATGFEACHLISGRRCEIDSGNVNNGFAQDRVIGQTRYLKTKLKRLLAEPF